MQAKIFVLFLFCALSVKAQNNPEFPKDEKELYKTLYALDSSLFSVAYKCEPQKVAAFFTDDLEFYHDKGGVTKSLSVFLENLKKNFCDPNRQAGLRRELIPKTMQVFPMGNYGAIQSGEHYFYEVYKDGTEKRVGIARFTHLWLLNNGSWRISRVLSYDHRSVPN